MTEVHCYIKYSPDTIDVSGSVLDRVDIWKRTTDGIGRFRVKLKNSNNEWVGQFLADDPIQIKIAGVIFLEGYLDKGFPYSLSEKDVYQQFYALAGRDYGQDLFNKLVNKTGKWMYKPQPADDIIDDMLAKVSSEITFTSPGTAPEISYTESGDEYLMEAFRKIAEKVNYDLHVDVDKLLRFFPIGTLNSGITLKCVAGASDNNILRLEHVEFDAGELRNYMVVKGKDVDDGWTEGNADGFTGLTGNIISDEFEIVQRGAASIKCALGTGDHCEIILTFPKYHYDYLPFDLFGKVDLPLWLYYTFEGTPFSGPWIAILLEDTEGNQIRWVWENGKPNYKKDLWLQYSVPVGTENPIKKYHSTGSGINQWRFYAPEFTTFNWKVKKITLYAKLLIPPPQVTALYLDGMMIPLPMVSYVQDGTSQGLYKVRQYPISARDLKSQKELDEYAQSQVGKRKDPVKGLKIWAIGTAGISIGGEDKWIPGYNITVNSPGDGINNGIYRIVDVHLIVNETSIMQGHDFIAEVNLVPYDAEISGLQLGYVTDPSTSLFRALSDRIRFMEKEEELKYDYFPPADPYAAQKIKVGEFASLSETIVAWSRLWEEDIFQDVDDACSIVADATAVNGKALKAPSTDSIPTVCTSPRIVGEISGEIYAIFAVKVSDKASTSNLCKLRVEASGEVRGSYDLAPNDFPFANKWHHFAVRAELRANDTNVYASITFFQSGLTDLYVDFIGILPANVPLGYADVTVTSHTGTDTSPHVGTDTDSHVGTDTDSHSGSGSASEGMLPYPIKDKTLYDYALPTDWTQVFSETCSSLPLPGNHGMVLVELTRVSGGACDVAFDIEIDSKIVCHFWLKDFFHSESGEDYFCSYFPFPWVSSAKNVTMHIERTGNITTINIHVKVYSAQKHSHSITQPIDHVVIQASDHAVTQPSDHSVTQPADHGTTGEGHEH